MTTSALLDKLHRPDAAAVASVLGPAAAARWAALIEQLDGAFGPLTPEWKHSGARHGWSLRLRRNGRNLVYLIPGDRRFLVALVFGDRAVQAIRASDVPDEVKALIEAAPPYVEGRGIRLEVRRREDLALVARLVAFKLAR